MIVYVDDLRKKVKEEIALLESQTSETTDNQIYAEIAILERIEAFIYSEQVEFYGKQDLKVKR